MGMAFFERLSGLVGAAGIVGVTLRYGSDALLRLVAGIAGVMTKDDKRRKGCIEILRILRPSQQPLPAVHSPESESAD